MEIAGGGAGAADRACDAAVSCIGLPVIAAPVRAFLPIGVQLIARPWREDVLFRAAAALEALGVCGYVPPE